MSQVNRGKETVYTHEGAVASHVGAEEILRRTVLTCLLWENTFYESGETVADRIAAQVPLVKPEVVAALAVEAREDMKLRHAPLLLVREMARHKSHKHLVAATIERVVQRPDELCELLALYAIDREGVKKLSKLSKQIQKGLARAFTKFNAYSLAKYNRKREVSLKDVLFLTHAKPQDEEQAGVWKKLIEGTLEAPDTWEVALSAGDETKKQVWTRLLDEGKLGALALLRNLRNMTEADVDENLIRSALSEMKVDRVLPFRFISAARHAPTLEPELEQAMYRATSSLDRLPGKTAILVDHSGSMRARVSSRSELDRFEAACALSILVRELADECRVFTFANDCALVPARRGFALRDAILSGVEWGGTYLGKAINHVNNMYDYDRLIVVTDEQSHDKVGAPREGKKGYMLNVATYENGVAYGQWTHINGWSESVLDFIKESEALDQK